MGATPSALAPWAARPSRPPWWQSMRTKSTSLPFCAARPSRRTNNALFFARVRALLVLHAICASVLVAASTHHLIWCLRRRFPQDRLFAAVAALAYAATFSLGLVMYPRYKVRVRVEYFDQPGVGLAWVA